MVLAMYENGADHRAVILRYDSAGNWDTSFSDDGYAEYTAGGVDTYAWDAEFQPDGKLLVSGTSNQAGQYTGTLFRIDSDGSLDTNFDGEGIWIMDYGTGSAKVRALTLGSDGMIYTAAHSGLDIQVIAFVVDSDDDGVIDSTETTDGTNPFDETDFLSSSVTDTDEDGVPDLHETRDGTSPSDDTDFIDSDVRHLSVFSIGIPGYSI